MFNKQQFKAKMVLADKTMKDMAAAMGINEATLNRKITVIPSSPGMRSRHIELCLVSMPRKRMLFFLPRNLRKRNFIRKELQP